eukprot:7648430-Pyramimonas_sp.AAC.1
MFFVVFVGLRSPRVGLPVLAWCAAASSRSAMGECASDAGVDAGVRRGRGCRRASRARRTFNSPTICPRAAPFATASPSMRNATR